MWFPYFKGQPTDYIYRYSGGTLRGGTRPRSRRHGDSPGVKVP